MMSLTVNKIGDTGASCLSDFILVNRTMKVLNLNGMTDCFIFLVLMNFIAACV